jgi:hypothetical protein
MEAKLIEITLGEDICRKLKGLYFADIPWIDCHQDVAKKFSALKVVARRFYVGLTETQMLEELARYQNQDIADAYSV